MAAQNANRLQYQVKILPFVYLPPAPTVIAILNCHSSMNFTSYHTTSPQMTFVIVFFLVGWDLRHQVLRPLLAYCTAPDDR
jgi:hypothetical protein